MKLFETPKIKILTFTVEDVITTSGGIEDSFTIPKTDGNDTPIL